LLVGQVPARHRPGERRTIWADAVGDRASDLLIGPVLWATRSVGIDHADGIGQVPVPDIRTDEHRRPQPASIRAVAIGAGHRHHWPAAVRDRQTGIRVGAGQEDPLAAGDRIVQTGRSTQEGARDSQAGEADDQERDAAGQKRKAHDELPREDPDASLRIPP
jgi:hypothetical protein